MSSSIFEAPRRCMMQVKQSRTGLEGLTSRCRVTDCRQDGPHERELPWIGFGGFPA